MDACMFSCIVTPFRAATLIIGWFLTQQCLSLDPETAIDCVFKWKSHVIKFLFLRLKPDGGS